MRTAELEKAKPVAFMLGEGCVRKFPDFNTEDTAVIERCLKEQFRNAEIEIKALQKSMTEPLDGYIFQKDCVYKVYAKHTPTKKITGDEARYVKKTLRDL